MRPLTSLLLVSLFIARPSLAGESDELAARVAADLKRYYQDSHNRPFVLLENQKVEAKPPPWEVPLKQISGPSANEQRQAAAYLVELVSQALKDEQSGAARWRATPFWGAGPENAARQLREAVADLLAKKAIASTALPVLRWYFDMETMAQYQVPIIKALAKLDGKEAAKLRRELVSLPHANAVVVVEALKQITERKATLPAAELSLLCQHYRASIREAARALNKQQGGPEPGTFNAAKAMRLPVIRKLMQGIGDLVFDPPPARARFIVVTTAYFDEGGKKQQTDISRGWLINQEGDRGELLTPFSQRQSFHKHVKPTPLQMGDSSTTTVEEVPIEAEVTRVEAIRKKNDDDFALSERGGLTGQFQGRGAGLYEVMLAHWLYASHQNALAARILFPALDSLYKDEYLLLMTRDRLGTQLGYRMLVAFVGERDYVKAEEQAKILTKQFPGTRFHAYAAELARQLPKRKDDFVKLKLPTPNEWAAIKAKLTRTEQIDFLCQRMRLLNCFQWGQPGGSFYSDVQYAEPCGISADAAWGESRGKTEVINPVVELAGQIDGSADKSKKQSKGLGLTVNDIAQLAPFLKDDWFLLTVSFWRDFAEDRNLQGSRDLFAHIINRVADKDICQVSQMATMTEAEKEQRIRQIIQWSRDNAGKGATGLLFKSWWNKDNIGLFYAGSVGLVLVLYLLKAILFGMVVSTKMIALLFAMVLILCVPVCWALSPDWENEQVLPIGNYVGTPVATLTVPCVSFLYDFSRRLRGQRIWYWRAPLEVLIGVPLWFVGWIWIEFMVLGWVWI